MSDEDLIKLWNMGLTKTAVAKEYMKNSNRKSKEKKEIKRINIKQALQHVEPILFRYRTRQLKGE